MDPKKDNLNSSLDPQTKHLGVELNFTGLIKKTEKIVAAIYMVTDLFDDREPLKTNMRESALSMVGLLNDLPSRSPVEKHVLFDDVKGAIRETISYIEIAKIITAISQMNALILEKELSKLQVIMEQYQDKNQEGDFQGRLFGKGHINSMILSHDLFDHQELLNSSSIEESSFNKGQNFPNNVLYKNPEKYQRQDGKITNQKTNQKQGNAKNDVALKINRRNNILRLIKDKKEVTIKDISLIIIDCSEKTIQRELNTLVSENVLKRVGKKRWSKYSLA